MLLIYIQELNPRTEYIFTFIFKDILKADFQFTDKEGDFSEYTGPKFSYGHLPVQDSPIHFASASLLFENEIVPKEIHFGNYKHEKVIFLVEKGILPFDPFAASFFLITRYEEYLPHKKDRHQRYSVESSTAYQGDFLGKPVVDKWALWIKEILKEHYPGLTFKEKSFTFSPTIDIDHAYAYKYKGCIRAIGALLIRLAKLRFSRVWNRILVHAGLRPDPYDSYQKQFDIHKKYNLKPIYFILLADYGKYDPNIHHNNSQFKKLIKKLENHSETGLHPSYRSNRNKKYIRIEKQRLESIVGKSVRKSRQHFIKLKLPDTYRNLIKEGIKEDFSMGYTTRSGFRASTSHSFFFFDLERNTVTDLRVHPFIIMDTTLKTHLKIRSKEVKEHIRPYVNEVKAVNGHFSYIFHNESIGGKRQWKNWGNIYEEVINLCLESADAKNT